jgi:beta-glucosidase
VLSGGKVQPEVEPVTSTEQLPQFPPGFRWGVATASYQVEGAVTEDGRGPSIWDTFSHTPGATHNGDTGDTACDHYRRYDDDVALMQHLGVDAYRFSIAWPRIQPTGTGPALAPGLDFYERLVDSLLAADIAPVATLYHWDLPQALEDRGGWMNRDTAARLADYAGLVAERLGDRVDQWITLNEPFVVTALGYGLGVHAPGHQLLGKAFPVAHHQLLAHGLATGALRAAGISGRIGITNAMAPVHPATGSEEDAVAAATMDTLQNWTYGDPLLLGRYPANVPDVYGEGALSVVHEGDLALIAAPVDFLGVNYYSPRPVRADPDGPLGASEAEVPGAPVTAMGWPVVPAAFTELLLTLAERYTDALPPIYITENGAAFDDQPDAEGRVHDSDRIGYIDSHLRALHSAMAAGIDVRGYFCWSLLDNFEWAEGYAKRFGLVRVDFETLDRTPKASYDWYRSFIARHRDGAR